MKKCFLTSLFLALSATLLWGQPVLSGPGAPLTLTFNGFGGAGFSPTPASDQLDSDAWAATGFSDGDLAFGQTITTGDYANGITTGTGEFGGGIYAFDDGSNQALWIQPTGGDFTPGSLTLRFVNGTGGTITSLDVAYDLIVLNDAPRGNTFDGSFSADGINFTPVASLAFLSPEVADNNTTTNNLTATITGLSVAPNDTLFLRWDSDDNLGGGSRDEFGLDNITLTGNTGSVSLAANFVVAGASFDEGAGTVSVDVALTTADTCQVGVSLGTGGTATDGTDFTFGGDTLIFSPNGSTTLSASLDLIDDMMVESDETLFLVLDSVFNCPIGMADTFELTIQDNDLPLYDIGLVTDDADGDGVGDSVGVGCELRGVVHGGDFNGGIDLQFTIIDPTGGIGVFSDNVTFGYTVTEGDSLHVRGSLSQFNGLTQINPDTLILISQGNALQTPVVVTGLDESTESELVRFNDAYLIDPTQWTGSGSGFNVEVTNGTDTIEVRIDNDVDLYSLPAPLDTFDVIGLGGQFDNSSPATEGYQLLPRDQFDLIRNSNGLPVYPIDLVTDDADGDGQADSLGVGCELRGVVHGIDLNGGIDLQFTIIDPTGGIGVFSDNVTFGYTVTEGDSVHIAGTLSEFNGLAQILPDTIIFISSGNATATPAVITALNESTESELVRFNNATLVDPAQWTGSGSGFNVEVTNGTDTIEVRIDNEVDLYSLPAPSGTFDVIGLGGQFDNNPPATEGYQLLPRYQQDIIPVVQPGFSLSPTSISANEGDGTLSFEVALATAFANPTSVEVNLLPGGTAQNGTDFTGWSDTVLNFPANSNGPFQLTLDLVDDNLVEGVETIVIGLANPTGGLTLGDSVITITIEDNDFPVYDIGLVTDDSNGDGLADSIGVNCEIRGVVHSIDFRGGGGMEVVLIDSTGGITVFEFDDVSGYGSSSSTEINQGDEFIVRGRVDQFRGLAQMRPDTLVRVSVGNSPLDPILVTALDETTESEYLRLECFKLVDPAEWPGSGSSENLLITNTVDTLLMRIDSDTDIDGTPVPTGYFNLIGTGGQFTFDDPPINGYQVRPSFLSEIDEFDNPVVSFEQATVEVDESADTLVLIVFQENGNPEQTQVRSELLLSLTTATEAVDFAFTPSLINLVGCGADMDTFELKIPIFDDADVEGDETFTIRIFGPTNNATLDIDTVAVTILDNDEIGIESLPQQAVRMYPNPAREQVRIESGQLIESITLTNLMGQQLRHTQPNAKQSSLNLRDLPAGMYSLRVQTAQGSWSDQLMIQR